MVQIFRAALSLFPRISSLISLKSSAEFAPLNPVKKSFFAPKAFVYGSSSVLDYKEMFNQRRSNRTIIIIPPRSCAYDELETKHEQK